MAISCGQSIRLKWRRVRAKLPHKALLKIYLLVYLNMFSFGFSAFMVFPYLPFLTEFLIPRLQEDEKDVGKYAGFIGGSVFFGRIFGSYFWGVISDLKGRKPVLVISAMCMGLSSLMFGFSVNFAMAVVSRFLLGFANGVISTCKAVISEVSDDSNQAFGVTVLGAAVGTGYIIGPAVAGAIADPVGQYNLTITNPFLRSFLTKFPFSLPPIFCFLLLFLSSLLTFCFLNETLGTKKSRKRSEINEMELAAIRSRLGVSDGVDQSQDSAQTSLCEEEEEGTDETRLLGGEESDDSESRTSNLFISNPAATNGAGASNLGVPTEGETQAAQERGGKVENQGEEEEEEDKEDQNVHFIRRNRRLSNFFSTLKKPLLDLRLFLCDCTALNSLLIYCVYSFGVVSYNEVLSLWAFTQPHLGGLGFRLHEIGICLTVAGVLTLPGSLITFPLLEKRLHSIRTFYLVLIMLVVLFLMLPHIHYLISYKPIVWFLLLTFVSLINGAVTTGFSSTIMFINNSVTLDKLGSINGVAVMMTSITRALAPVIAGSLFSVSLSDATLAFGFPVNYNLVFGVLSIVFMVTVFMVACLPVSINKQKIIEDL